MDAPPHHLPQGRILLIPDIHMDLPWVRSVLKVEAGNWDHVVFLGDYFDSFKRPPEVGTFEEVCIFLKERRAMYGDRATFLLGNHDIAYLEMLPFAQTGRMLPEPLHCCSGFNPDGARLIARCGMQVFFDNCRFFVAANGFLISHAGVAKKFWRSDLPWLDPYESLEDLCQIALDHLRDRRMAIIGCGAARGGSEDVGGITWQDWNNEFEDSANLPPQIVGHTQSPKDGIRRKGRSYCIDGGQSCWALLNSAGELIPRSF